MRTDANKNTPIFQAHGGLDNVVKLVWGKAAKQALEEKLGLEVEWHCYPRLTHSADPQEITDMDNWMQKRLPTLP